MPEEIRCWACQGKFQEDDVVIQLQKVWQSREGSLTFKNAPWMYAHASHLKEAISADMMTRPIG